MLNKTLIIGNLTRDPEVKQLNGGNFVFNCAIAVSEKWKDKNTGEQKEDTTFTEIKAFGKLAEIMGGMLHKGSKVLVEGPLKLDMWDDDNGQKRQRHYIRVENFEALDPKPADGNQGNNQVNNQNNNQNNNQGNNQGNNFNNQAPQFNNNGNNGF
jgi:single-strand DNA-binding protein